ncbi:ATP-binding protein [Breznakiellaceae bacterium SP9]
MSKRPLRFFNTTGPCNPDDHYMLPPAERLIGAQLPRYIKDNLYWVLHAPRQTGKTTFLQSWAREINASLEAVACYVTVERCQGVSEAERAIPAVCNAITKHAHDYELAIPQPKTDDPLSMLNGILVNWAELVSPKPLIVLFDEVDVLQDEALIGFLRQLRDGFAGRGPGKFPVSIALVGMRDLKDYITAAKGGIAPNPGSPFNIKEDSSTLGNFQKDDIRHLFAQRTAENGQVITEDALEYVWEQSKGQPWIVNSLFKRATMRILNADSTETVTIAHIEEARRQMIEARETHLDALAYRLDNPQIRSLMETLITGEPDPLMAEGDTFKLCLDLGLVRSEGGTPSVANPIYREVIARQLTYSTQMAITEPEWQWQKPDGTLDMDALLKEFQAFWRTNADSWEAMMNYPEAFPHLLLMAFLQRVTNGKGRIEREYAAGRGRMDLAVEFNGSWDIIEVKLLRDTRTFKAVQAEGKKQILRYRDTFAPTPGTHALRDGKSADCYLVIFDRRSKKPAWYRRLKWLKDGEITVVGA